MVKGPFWDTPIDVYTCITNPERKCIARIGRAPVFFTGKTPMQAKRAAEDWRQAEREKAEAQEAAAAKRAQALAEARQAVPPRHLATSIGE